MKLYGAIYLHSNNSYLGTMNGLWSALKLTNNDPDKLQPVNN